MPPQFMQGLEEGDESVTISDSFSAQLWKKIRDSSTTLDVTLWNTSSLSSGTVNAYACLGRRVPTADLAAAAFTAFN